jgi:hypothetical protein
MGEGSHRFDRVEEIMSGQDIDQIRVYLADIGIEASLLDVLEWSRIEAVLNPPPEINFDPKVMRAIEAAMSIEVSEKSVAEVPDTEHPILPHVEIDEAKRLARVGEGFFVPGC